MARWRNPLAGVRSTTVGIVGLTGMWGVFQWKDPSPPAVLDQLLVAAFGIWFATEAKRNGSAKADTGQRRRNTDKETDVEDSES